jgi:PAS domain S-box-containing protein
VSEPLLGALAASGLAASACLLRREGSVLVAGPLDGSGRSGEGCTLPQRILNGNGNGQAFPPHLIEDAGVLSRLTDLIGADCDSAFVMPLEPPSPRGGHETFLLVGFRADPHGSSPRTAEDVKSRIQALGAAGLLITPRAAAGESASNGDGLYRAAFESSSAGLILLARDGKILDMNAAGSRASGPASSLQSGDSLLDAIPPVAAERVRSLMEAAESGVCSSDEVDLSERTDEPRPQHMTVDMIRSAGEASFLLGLRALTERDRLVELLRREKDFTRSLLEAANACVLGLDVQGRTLLFNRVFQQATGYGLADMLGRPAMEILVPEEYRAAWRDSHLRALAGEAVEDRDFHVRTRTAEMRVLCLSAGRINDADGECRGVLWTGRDVTAERQRESELRDREEMTSRSLNQLKEFSRISSMILQEKDLDSVCRMFVRTISEVSTFRRAILTLCDDDFRGYCWYFSNLTDEEIEIFHRNKMTGRERITIFQERFRLGNSYYIPHTEGWDYEGVRSHGDATAMVDWHPDDFLFIPLYGTNRKIVGIVSVDDPQNWRRPTAESISPLELFANQVAHTIEERRLDQEVRQSTERYRTLVETMHDGIISVDLRERLLFANAALAELVGMPETLLTCRPLGTLLEADDLATFRAETALHQGGRVTGFEIRLRSRTGELIPVHVSASPFREDGQLVGCFAVVRDLREQKKGEAEKKVMQEQLMQAEKLSALGELISGIAHELNNPLTGVMGYSQLLLNAGASPETEKNLEKIHKEAVRCQKIVQNLLTFARKRAPERRKVDVNALVEATLELRAYQLKVDGVEVTVDLDPDLPPTSGDFHELQQVFINIINNAHHAMIDSHRRPSRLSLRTRREGETVRVSIADSGPGISEEHISKIFDPFFTTKEIGKGTGLGLSLSYGIIKEHEGSIGVTSRPGEGATFTVVLPVRDVVDEEPAQELAEKGRSAVQGSNILVVDDEETILELLESVLESSGHRVETACNGRQALEKIQRADFDIIITDVKMPDMGGDKLYERVSEIKPHLKRRVIFSTGDTVNPVTQALFKATGNPYLAKPFRLEEVDSIIQKVLDEPTDKAVGRPN